MATSYGLHISCNLAFVVVLLAPIIAQSSHANANSGLVEKVCRKVYDYHFCIDALNSDPRTPGADEITLAKVAFDAAERKAVSTESQIASLLSNSTGTVHQLLEKCRGNYVTVLEKIRQALNELDSKTYGRLVDLGYDVMGQAGECELSFKGESPLTESSAYLSDLSDICVAVGHLFS